MIIRRLAFLAALTLAAPLAAAADPAPVCAGRDLSRDPASKPDFAAHADEIVNGDGLLWKIEKPGLAPSFLYGTIHSTTPTAIALANEAVRYIEGATSVATELGSLDAARKVDLSAGLLKAGLSPEKDTMSGVIAPKDEGVVDDFLGARGYPREMAHHLKLWLLAVAVSLPACETEGQRLGLPEVDQMIAEAGEARHLPVIGLETIDEQLQTISSTPEALAAMMLVASARAPSVNDDAYATLLSLYLQKRPSAALAILDAIPELTPKERAAEAEFTRLLLVGRNETMARRSAPLLNKGGAFIAVGALHLSGKGGLIALLRGAGYQVTKVW